LARDLVAACHDDAEAVSRLSETFHIPPVERLRDCVAKRLGELHGDGAPATGFSLDDGGRQEPNPGKLRG
jgi:hypothetical protein